MKDATETGIPVIMIKMVRQQFDFINLAYRVDRTRLQGVPIE